MCTPWTGADVQALPHQLSVSGSAVAKDDSKEDCLRRCRALLGGALESRLKNRPVGPPVAERELNGFLIVAGGARLPWRRGEHRQQRRGKRVPGRTGKQDHGGSDSRELRTDRSVSRGVQRELTRNIQREGSAIGQLKAQCAVLCIKRPGGTRRQPCARPVRLMLRKQDQAFLENQQTRGREKNQEQSSPGKHGKVRPRATPQERNKGNNQPASQRQDEETGNAHKNQHQYGPRESQSIRPDRAFPRRHPRFEPAFEGEEPQRREEHHRQEQCDSPEYGNVIGAEKQDHPNQERQHDLRSHLRPIASAEALRLPVHCSGFRRATCVRTLYLLEPFGQGLQAALGSAVGMGIEVKQEGGTVSVQVQQQRLDGDNDILNALKKGNFFGSELRLLVIDFEPVEFINSLGITELVNIHRACTALHPEGVEFRFLNVDKKVNAILELVEIQKFATIQVKS